MTSVAAGVVCLSLSQTLLKEVVGPYVKSLDCNCLTVNSTQLKTVQKIYL